MSKINKYLSEEKLNEGVAKEIMSALDTFKNAIRDLHGEPLTPMEVKYIKKEIDRLAKGYKGM